MSNWTNIFVMSPFVVSPAGPVFEGPGVYPAAAESQTVTRRFAFAPVRPTVSPVYSSAASSFVTFAVGLPESDALLGSFTVIVEV